MKPAQLRGYLLEEALAWLLRNSGYQQVVEASEDPDELTTAQDGSLCVIGRGARHQVDVLGEFVFTPAFSLPVRMFLESKFYTNEAVGLATVRNAHGVIHDINQNYTAAPDPTGMTRPRRRYHYVYSLFSTSGFSTQAQRYALAHQISLIDLSGPSFAWLRDTITKAASEIISAAAAYHGAAALPVPWLRATLRRALGNVGTPPGPRPPSPQGFAPAAKHALERLAEELQQPGGNELLLAFPSAPLVLTLSSAGSARFLAYSEQHPTHQIRLRREGHGPAAEWTVTPLDHGGAYALTFRLPPHIEAWISDAAEHERARTQRIKKQFLAELTLYRVAADGTINTVRLRYDPAALRGQ